jgi:hypothetical protein
METFLNKNAGLKNTRKGGIHLFETLGDMVIFEPNSCLSTPAKS